MTGPRSLQWRPNDPADLLWVEALDKGDLKNKVPNRDRLLSLKAPFTGEPGEIAKTGQRFSGIQFFEKGGRAFIEDSERQTRRVRTFQIEVDDPAQAPKLVWSRNSQDRYKDPARPCSKPSRPAAASACRTATTSSPPASAPAPRATTPSSTAITSPPAKASASSSAMTTTTKWSMPCSTTTARSSSRVAKAPPSRPTTTCAPWMAR